MKRFAHAPKMSGSRRWLRFSELGLAASAVVSVGLGCGGIGISGDDVSTEARTAIRATPSPSCDPRNLRIVGGDIAMVPEECRPTLPGQGLGLNHRHVLFANFEGVDVRGGDTSLENEGLRQDPSGSLMPVIQIDQYGPSDPKRYDTILAIQKKVAGFYADFNVDVVISRPLSGDYMMTVVGDHETKIGLGPPVVGISPGDCHNASETNTNYAFTASLSENPEQSAVTIAHEAGHAYGLGHTLNMEDIMYPSVSPAKGFETGIARDPGPCNLNPGVDVQDGRQVLIDNLGARPPGLEKPGVSAPPVVNITAPADGATVGRDLTIAVSATTQARGGIDRVTLALSLADGGKFKGAHPVAELRPPSSSAEIKLSAAGNYQLIATAYDQFGNVSLTRSQFTVATPTCTVPNDCAPGQRCTNNTCVTPQLPEPTPAGDPAASLRAYGTACNASSECLGGTCAITPVGQICTHYCNPERICAGAMECVDGICLPPIYPRSAPKLGQLGGKCSKKEDCFTGECSPYVDLATPRYCTRSCDPEVAWSCPSTMACQSADTATGMRNVCINRPIGQATGDGGGGCSLSGSSTEAAGRAGWAAALGLLAFSLLRRRRMARQLSLSN